MPLSQDNQDYKTDAEQSKNVTELKDADANKMDKSDTITTIDSDDLKGKKVDADPTKEEGEPAKV